MTDLAHLIQIQSQEESINAQLYQIEPQLHQNVLNKGLLSLFKDLSIEI